MTEATTKVIHHPFKPYLKALVRLAIYVPLSLLILFALMIGTKPGSHFSVFLANRLIPNLNVEYKSGVLNKTILFVTHDFDEALRLADRIAIMKEGVIEQLDTPANIVLSPATEYVRKFTEEVPREKVLKIESVMDVIDSAEELSDLKVSKDALIETVAEAVLNEQKPVAVTDANNNVVGAVHASKVIHVLFGSKSATKL